MTLYALKPAFQNMLRPLVRWLFARGVTANQLTLSACALSVSLGVLLSVFAAKAWLFYLLPVCLLLRMALNAMDGMLAREFGQQSALGAYLNEITDMVADAALYLPFAFVLPGGGMAVGMVIFLAALSESVGILGQVYGRHGRRYDGPMGKSDRALAFGVLALAYALAGSLTVWVTVLVYGLAGLVAWTIWRRIRNGLA